LAKFQWGEIGGERENEEGRQRFASAPKTELGFLKIFFYAKIRKPAGQFGDNCEMKWGT